MRGNGIKEISKLKQIKGKDIEDCLSQIDEILSQENVMLRNYEILLNNEGMQDCRFLIYYIIKK